MDIGRFGRRERRKTMYRTENFSVTSNIDVSVIKEVNEGREYYALVKISLFGRESYGICTLGGGYAFESVGDNIKDAIELFELILNATPSVEHLFDVVSDFRREKALGE